ncbi:hypothetical protein ACROYT_G026423 [Oculina patagonica]
MRHFLVLVSLILFAAAEDPVVNDNVPDVGQPGSACNPLAVGQHVIIKESCTNGSSPPGTVCDLSCPSGYKLTGPPFKQCGNDGVWTPPSGPISCQDINECEYDKGGCSHECVNDDGGHHCACPDPLVLSDDNRNCRAVGLLLNCSTHAIEVTVPKTALRDLQGDFLSLLDPTCDVIETPTHYIFKTALDKCGTKRRSTPNFIVYSNKIVERHAAPGSIITRVGEDEFDIPFCCYYLNNGITSAVGIKPEVKQLYLNEDGYGRFSIRMDFFHGQDYQSAYSWGDFPIEVAYRQRLYFEVSIATLDQSLEVMAANCCSTPTADHNKEHRFRHEMIHEGCPVDDTVQMEPSSSPQKKRFSVEAFKFVGDFPFVYLHCSVVVCRVNDPDSRCSKGCVPGLHVNPPYSVMEKLKEEAAKGHRAKRALDYKEPKYLISKGPFSLNDETVNDGPVIALKGPQQDRSKLAEQDAEKNEERREGWSASVTNGLMVVIAAASVLALVVDVAAEQLMAPGEVNCPRLQVGAHVITDHSCTSAPSVAETVCSFECLKGYRLSGPSVKHCQLDGTWSDQGLPVECEDVNECDVENGFCSHICKNTPGGYHCECPHPLYLDPENQRKCKAHGVQLNCKPNHMEIVLPRNLIHNLEHEHLSLLDPACRANGNATHYSLSTDITQCGTTSHVYKNFIVYTNRVVESPNENSDVITHVGENEIKVPFSCYFNDLEIVHAVGYKPVAKKIHVYVKGRGEYALSLDIFKDGSYGGGARALVSSSAKYTQADFPISVQLRERVYVQASLDTREKDLKIFASNCCSTPMQDHEATIKFRHPLIVEGCPRDPSVRFHASSDPTKVRFSFEAFQFLGDHDYVFIHCRVHVCDVNDANSRCAKGCLSGGNPVVQDHAKHSKKAQQSDKPAKKSVAQPKEKHIKKVVAPASDKTKKLHAAAKKLAGKPAVQPDAKRAKASLPSEKKVQDHAKAPEKKSEKTAHRVMKRAAARSHKRGVLGSADLSNVKDKNKRSSIAPSATNILLVAMTVASIMALVGVAFLGRKAMKAVNNPYNYEPLLVN